MRSKALKKDKKMSAGRMRSKALKKDKKMSAGAAPPATVAGSIKPNRTRTLSLQ